MRILMIRGSPHREGSSNMLADSFAEGARESGHEVEFFDAAHADIRPCVACDGCRSVGSCVQRDDFEALKEMIDRSDMIVFVTPLYFFNMTAQLKRVIDRFYSFNGRSVAGKKAAVLVAQHNPDPSICEGLLWTFRNILGFLGMELVGTLAGTGCGNPVQTASSKFVEAARDLGRSI